MVLPLLRYINQNLIIQQISAKMNFEIIEQPIEIIENNQGLYIDLIDDKKYIIDGNFLIEDTDEEIILPNTAEHIYEIYSQPLEFTGSLMQDYKPPIKDSPDSAISDCMDHIQELERRKLIITKELRSMTVNSTPYKFQRQILINTRKLIDYYRSQLKDLIKNR